MIIQDNTSYAAAFLCITEDAGLATLYFNYISTPNFRTSNRYAL